MEKRIVLAVFFMLTFIFGLVIGIFVVPINKYAIRAQSIKNIDVKYNEEDKYFILKNYYNGEYDYQSINITEDINRDLSLEDNIKVFNTKRTYSYNEYSDFCNRWNLVKKYSDENKRYMIIANSSLYGSSVAKIVNVSENSDTVNVYLWEGHEENDTNNGYFIAIPIDSNIHQFEINNANTKEEFDNIVKYGTPYRSN